MSNMSFRVLLYVLLALLNRIPNKLVVLRGRPSAFKYLVLQLRMYVRVLTVAIEFFCRELSIG